MADSFKFSPWSAVSTNDGMKVGNSMELKDTPSTPIRKQPACFRVCTPFPIATSAGGVKVVGKNATETGFSFPPLGDAGLTSFGKSAGPKSESKNWLRLQAEMTDAAVRNVSKTQAPPVPASQFGPLVELKMFDSAVTSPMEFPFRRRSSGDDSHESAIAGDIPCRESLFRLSLSDATDAPSPLMDNCSQKENTTRKQMEGIPESETEEIARLEQTIEQKNHELTQAHAEIQRLVDCIKTLEFKRDEYIADDGALGMAEYLAWLENELGAKEDNWDEQLNEERQKRTVYQNRYYEMVSKNADLEERIANLVQEQQQATQTQNNEQVQMLAPASGTRPKRRIVVRGGGAKKPRGQAKKR